MSKKVKNIFLRFQKKYTGKDINGSKPYLGFNAIEEHLSQSKEIIWGQFTTSKEKKLVSSVNLEQLSKNKGYAFFISDDNYGGTRLFYGKILDAYDKISSDSDSNEEINPDLIPNYYKEHYMEQKENKETLYDFKVGLWLKLEFFRELDLSVLNHLFSLSNKDYSIADTRRRRTILLSYVNFEPNVAISSFENVSVMRRMILEDGSIVPPIWSKNNTIGIINKTADNNDKQNKKETVISLYNDKSLDVFENFFIEKNNEELDFNVKKDYKPYIYEFRTKDKLIDFDESQSVQLYTALDVESPNFKIDTEDLIKGEVVFCASPEKTIDAFIQVTPYQNPKKIDKLKIKLRNHLFMIEHTLDNLPNEFNLNNNKKVTEAIKKEVKISSRLSEVKIDIFNVGNANCVEISLIDSKKNKSKIMFDVGYKNTNNQYDEIGKSVDAIFLSHWDNDHIKGALDILDINRNALWFVPRINKYSGTKFYNLLLCYLLIMEKLRIFSVKFNNKLIYRNNGFALYKGTGTGNTGKIENNLGIIIELECGKQNVLLTGDCEYKYLPNEIKDRKYDYLVVPHHGANTEKDKLNIPIKSKAATTTSYRIDEEVSKKSLNKGTAIISCKTGRADEHHIKYLENNLFDIVETNSDSLGIRIDLK